MNYHAFEFTHALLSPWRLGLEALRSGLDHPLNPFGATPMARGASAACEVFEQVTRRYRKPEFAITQTVSSGLTVPVRIEDIAAGPFCTLRRFRRDESILGRWQDPKVLIVAPMSGHFATLLRGTITALLPDHDIHITDWHDARDVPVEMGSFGLGSFIDTIEHGLKQIGPGTHVVAVSQSSVPALAVTATLAARNDPVAPASLTLLGGPIDPRQSPTLVNRMVESRPLSWFDSHVISHVPFPNAGAMRRVYPGFMQLTGFMTMDLERHVTAHAGLFNDLVLGDADSVRQHREFYEDYLAVMDLPAEFYLDTVETVFQKHALARGAMRHANQLVDCDAIRSTALLTVEAGQDVICGSGQTHAAQDLCRNLPAHMKHRFDDPGAGHFGIFNGPHWRNNIAPRVSAFIRETEARRASRRQKPSERLRT